MKRRILIISRYFPPLDSIASVRIYSFAKYLHQMDYQVDVLTTTKVGQIIHPYDADTSFCQVFEVPYFDPFASSGIKKKNLAKLTGWKQWLLRKYRERLVERIPGRTDFWISPAKRFLRKLKSEGVSYDWIISSYGPPSSLMVGRYAKRLFQCPWVADYRDLWIENHVTKGVFPFTILERVLERNWVKEADLITTVAPALQHCLQKKFSSIPVKVLENGFDFEIKRPLPEKERVSPFHFLYTGTLYARRRVPTPFFQAIAELIQEDKIKPNSLKVSFYGNSSEVLQPLIDQFHLHEMVRDCGPVSYKESLALQQQADALLFLESEKPEIDGILTGKLFEYLTAHPPIFAVGITPESAPGRIILKAQAGIVLGVDIPKIKEQVIEFCAHRASFEKDEEFISQYSRKKQVEKLASWMEGILCVK